jgi:hypothetical protein
MWQNNIECVPGNQRLSTLIKKLQTLYDEWSQTYGDDLYTEIWYSNDNFPGPEINIHALIKEKKDAKR